MTKTMAVIEKVAVTGDLSYELPEEHVASESLGHFIRLHGSTHSSTHSTFNILDSDLKF